MRHPRIIIAAIAIATMATVGGITVASAAGSSNPQPTATATVHTAPATVQGTTETILVDAHGRPLYTYQPDTTTTSHVSGELAALWPPLVAATPTTSDGTGRLTSIATTNGQQVAYNGHFLYTFVEDSPGHVTGQGVQDFFVATPGLSAAGATSTASAGSGNSYRIGY